MTLDLNWKSVKDGDDLCIIDNPERPGSKTTNPVTYVIGIMMMHTGIVAIPDRERAAEFYMRVKLIEACFGGGFIQKLVRDDETGEETIETIGLSVEDIYAHIGLRSNVSAYTPTQFFKHLREDVAVELRQRFMKESQHHIDESIVALGEHVKSSGTT